MKGPLPGYLAGSSGPVGTAGGEMEVDLLDLAPSCVLESRPYNFEESLIIFPNLFQESRSSYVRKLDLGSKA